MSSKIIILLPVHNRIDVTRRFLECLNRQTYLNWHLVLIDDGCTDGTPEMAKSMISSITILKGDGNLWWAGALHCAYKYLKKKREFKNDDIVLIINDDVLIESDYLSTVAATFNNNKFQKILVPSIAVDNSNGKPDGAGVHYDNKRFTFTQTDEIDEINCLSSWGLFLRFDDFVESDGFYPKLIPHYLSDFEYTYRQIVKNNLKPVVNKELKIIFFPEESGYDHPSKESSFVKYTKALFSNKNKSNPVHWIVFVLLTGKIPWSFFKILKIIIRTSGKMVVVLFRGKKTNEI